MMMINDLRNKYKACKTSGDMWTWSIEDYAESMTRLTQKKTKVATHYKS